MLHIKSLLLVLCMLLILTACGGRDTHYYTDNDDVKVIKISHHEDGDFLVINASIANRDKDEVTHTVYRVEWFDDKDNLLEKTSWMPIVVKGGVIERIKVRSTVPGAKEYTLVISNDAS